MSSFLNFDAAWIFWPGGVVIAGLLVLMGWRLRRRGLSWWESSILIFLRAIALVLLLFLAARPVNVQNTKPRVERSVAVLMDRSLSMSVVENGESRYHRMVAFLGEKLAPVLQKEGWKVKPFLFADSVQNVAAENIAGAEVSGNRTNIAGGLRQAVALGAEPPLAVVLLSDGIANENSENSKALSALLDRHTPVIAVGFGSDAGPATLALQKVTAPAIAPVKQEFRVTAQISLSGAVDLPSFELLFLRDGQLLQTKIIPAFSGSRTWSETFPVTETEEGRHEYTVQLSPPDLNELVTGKRVETVQVSISNEKDLRVLFIQGVLTWDYKFIGRALHSDPAVRLTGLSRTSEHSLYRQNVEKAGELIDGFPTSLEQIAPFRVVVISNLQPKDLTPAQQEILTRFCGELGGGVLMLGGPGTFDGSWQGSILEKLLPVTFDPLPGLVDVEKPFHLKLTEEAMHNPIFQITEGSGNAAAWQTLPAFLQYGRVERAKPGAVVWAEHDEDNGPDGKRILMASQFYGAGRSAVICVQNFWGWRLAKETDPQQFDRFWRQLFRYLGESGRQSVLIDFTDQNLEPPAEIHATLERQAVASDFGDAQKNPTKPVAPTFTVLVRAPDQKEIVHESVELPAGRQVPFAFRAEQEGLYSILVQDGNKVTVSERTLQLANNRVELERTGRDMENLRQWAALTQGAAFTVENCSDISPLIQAMREKIAAAEKGESIRTPLGLEGRVMLLLLFLLGTEWILRKRWNLI